MHVIPLFTLASGLHNEVIPDVSRDPFLKAVNEAGKGDFAFDVRGNHFEEWNSLDCAVIYVRTGGTEGAFREAFHFMTGPVTLLTSGRSNSLAASMEILSFLRRQGREGRILHGSPQSIAFQISEWEKTSQMRLRSSEENHCFKPFTRPAKFNLSARYGVVGQPSDWLIASDPNRDALKNLLDVTLVDIPISELVKETEQVLKESSLASLYALLPNCEGLAHLSAIHSSLPCALAIYVALKHIVERYGLSGVTVRCFDLLDTLHNTGCLALAMLNAEGVTAACEGDIPALISMAVARKVTGMNGFQANPSRINPDNGDMVFAHCTAPLDILRSYAFDTHFESGIGVAIRGEMSKGPVTLFKLSPDLDECFICEGILSENLNEPYLCRTQLKLHMEDVSDYFLRHSIGNHHIILPGSYEASLKEALGV